MAKEMFERSKPHMNVGVIGHVHHGKTTLISAITKVLAEEGKATFITPSQLNRCLEETGRGLTIYNKYTEIETEERHYALIDVPGHADYVKTTVAGMSEMDAAILVVSAADGPMPQTREHILLARQMNVSQVIVFLNKCDMIDDEELLELVSLETRELLSRYEFPGDDVPIIEGSALNVIETDGGSADGEYWEKMKELMKELDAYFVTVERSKDDPFYMPISHTYNSNDAVVVCGQIKSGNVKKGDEVEINSTSRDQQKTSVLSVEIFNKLCDTGLPGDQVALLLKKVKSSDVKRGDIICKPGSLATYTLFLGEVYVLSKEEGGRHTPFFNGYTPMMYVHASSFQVTIDTQGVELIMPGDNCNLRFRTIGPVNCSEGQRFVLREGGRTIGAGVISQICG